MSSNIQVFGYEDFMVRTYTDENGEVWLVAKDVCNVLGIQNHRDAITVLDEDEKRVSEIPTPSNGGYSSVNLINEPGLYKLTFRSKKPNAKEFTRRVTHEILPSIRKTGSYTAPKARRTTHRLPINTKATKAIERILHKVFNCKKNADYQEVLALDDMFRQSFGYSALEYSGIKLVRKIEHVRYFEDTGVGLDFLCPYYVDEEVFYWEHGYNLEQLAARREPEEYC